MGILYLLLELGGISRQPAQRVFTAPGNVHCADDLTHVLRRDVHDKIADDRMEGPLQVDKQRG